MRVQIVSEGISLSQALVNEAHDRLKFALGRFDHRITEAVVRFEDVNGPRGGRDVHCRVKLMLIPRGELNVSAWAVSSCSALNEAAKRARRCVIARVRRRRTLRRRSRESLSVNSVA
jgi:ribosome-associated translation inhibitor RaiA